MIHSSAIGAISSAVTGAAAASKVIAKPNTRPCFSKGTTRWMTVCSAASAAGISAMNSQTPSDEEPAELAEGGDSARRPRGR